MSQRRTWLSARGPGLWLGAWLGFAATWSSRHVAAQAVDAYSLQWVREDGAESCVSPAALGAMLEEVLGDSRKVAPGKQRRLEGTVAPAGTALGFQATIRVLDAQGELIGERQLATPHAKCSTLTQPVLLVLTMSIDPEAALKPLPVEVEAEPLKEPAPAAPVRTPLPPEVARRPPEAGPQRPAARGEQPVPPAEKPEAGWSVLAGVSAALGLAPDPRPGMGLDGRLRLVRAWSASLSALAWLPSTVPVAGPRALADGVDFSAMQLALSTCFDFLGKGRVRAGSCAGGVLGFRRVSAGALQERNDPWQSYFGPQLSLESGYFSDSSWFVRAGLGAMASLRKDRFYYLDHEGRSQLLYETGTLAGWGLLGAGIRL
jgi:hypothetical protein